MLGKKKELPSTLFLAIAGFFNKEYNFDTHTFLEKKQLCISTLKTTQSTIHVSYVTELIDEVVKQTKDNNVLFKLSSLATPKNIGVLGYLMLHSKNICEALDKLCKYYLLIGKSIKPVFIKIDDGYKIGIYANDEEQGLSNLEKYKAQIHLFAIVHLINNITSEKIKPEYITFMQDKPLYFNEHENIIGIKVIYNADENAMYFSKDIQKISTLSSNDTLVRSFEKEAEETLQLRLVGESLQVKISGLILVSTSELDISLESIANKAKLHPRVLQKYLKKENTSFSKILEEVRKKLCAYYLLKDVDIATIAVSLGYSELSSFFRAFKRWYFMTPKQWLLKKKNENL